MRRRSTVSVQLNFALLILELLIGIDFTLTDCIWTLFPLVGGEGDTFRSDFYAVMPSKVGKLKLVVCRLHITWIAYVIGHCVFY